MPTGKRHITPRLSRYIAHWKDRARSGAIKKDILGTAVYALKCWLVAVAAMVVFQRQLMYFPSGAGGAPPENARAVHYETGDGPRISAWYAPPEDGRPVIVLFHGNAGNALHRAFKMDFFTRRGYGFLLAEYRGYGGLPGWPSEENLYLDAGAALEWLIKEQGVTAENIILYGESIGTGVASHMALRYKNVKALVLEAPFTSMKDAVGDVYWWVGPARHLVLDRYDNIAKAPRFTMPVLIVNGTGDEVIPAAHGQRLLGAVGSSSKTYISLEGGGHDDLARHGLLEHILAFTEGL